jgi:TRAP transporter 4TM/12TM fusion protein
MASLDLDARPQASGSGFTRRVISVLAVAWSLFHLYTGFLGVMAPGIAHENSFVAYHLTFGVVLVFLVHPLLSAQARWAIWGRSVDVTFALAGLASLGYLGVNFVDLQMRNGALEIWEYVLGGLAILVLLEGSRRAIGAVVPLIAIAFLLYALFGSYIPGPLGHRGFSLQRIIDANYVLWDGILGSPAHASAKYVFLFILFAVVLRKGGGGQFFIDFATAIFGMVRGGPAKIAVVASSFFGTMSGSSVANVVSTGSFTIPLMIRTGYQRHFAGAVEAVASSGGQIMPPVMGAAAFVMAEILGIPYLRVCLAAAIPAVLYYLALFTMVDLEALRTDLTGVPKAQIPRLPDVLQRGIHLSIPLAVIVFLLVQQYSAMVAGFWATVSAAAASQLRRHTRMAWRDMLASLEDGARGAVEVAVCCGCLGIIISTLLLTGLASNLAGFLVDLAQGNVLVLLILTMLTSLLMGMGLPTIACYVILAALVAPALVDLGMPKLVVHLFIFYFGTLSHITPPVAIAAYAAAGIANSNPMRVGFTALRLGLTGFIVPFMFVYGPELIFLSDSVATSLVAALTASVGVFALSQGVMGLTPFGKTPLGWWRRVLFLGGALLLIKPGLLTDGAGVILLAVALGTHRDVQNFLRRRIGRKREESLANGKVLP